jgi:hypothetical protein
MANLTSENKIQNFFVLDLNSKHRSFVQGVKFSAMVFFDSILYRPLSSSSPRMKLLIKSWTTEDFLNFGNVVDFFIITQVDLRFLRELDLRTSSTTILIIASP